MSQERYEKLAAEARAAIREVTVEDFTQGRIHPEHVLIDVREESEWQKAHAAAAIHLSRGVIEREIETAVPDPATPIVCYCAGGNRSAFVAESLQRMGYTNVVSLAGGFKEWEKARLPIVPGGTNPS